MHKASYLSMQMLIGVLKTWKVLIEGTFRTNKNVRLIAINHKLTRDNHAIKYFNRLTALIYIYIYIY